MKMKRNTHLWASLILTLGLGLTACTDTDLATSSQDTDNTAEEQLSDADFQKQIALQCLLQSVASVDSLPDNWNTADYHVATATIGTPLSENDPSVRLVATTSTEEAYRIYKGLTSSSITTEPTQETWAQQGIGSITFTPNNQDDRYATLTLNVQQLPNLQEIRFVPASALGQNGIIKPKGEYYQFGDVVKQTINGKDFYWVCVRPCSKDLYLRKTHWCSLQLDFEGHTGSNYKKFEYAPYKPIHVPTGLAKNQSDAERMIQNFFNVLRIIANPTCFNDESVTGIGEIQPTTEKEKTELYNRLKAVSAMWDELGIWNKIKDELMEYDLRSKFASDNFQPHAFYNGYSKKSKVRYMLWDMALSNNANADKEKTLFNTVEKTTPTVSTSTQEEKNFNYFERHGKGNFTLDNENEYRENQFIVNYKTGAQLEDLLIGNTDNDPSKSFTKNGLTDVVSYSSMNLLNTLSNHNEAYPLFTFGDIATKTTLCEGTQFCIKENVIFKDEEDETGILTTSINNYELAYPNELKAVFICRSQNTQPTSKNDDISNIQPKLGMKLSDQMTKIILFHLMNAYLDNKNLELPFELDEDAYSKEKSSYRTLIKNLYEVIIKDNDAISFTQNGNEIQVKAQVYSSNATITNDEMEKPSVVSLTYNTANKSFTYQILREEEPRSNNFLRCYGYTDSYNYQNDYVTDWKLTLTSDIRRKMKDHMHIFIDKFLKTLPKY